MTPIRVGVNTLFLDPGRRSGTATYTWSVVEQLMRMDDVDLVLYAQDGYVPSEEIAAQCTVRACPRFSSAGRRVLWEQARLPRHAADDGVDVLFSTGYVSPLRGPVARVVTIHDLYYERCPEAIPRVRRAYYRTFIPRSVAACAAVIAVSENTRRDLEELIPASRGKTTVVYQGARSALADVEPVPPPACRPYFLMVASVTRNKNAATVVEAVGQLRDRGVDAELRVVGADPYGVLAEAIAAHDAGGYVHHVGEVGDAELAGWYRSSVAVVNASTYEGFGLPVLEAQLLDAPLICSDAGPLPEVAGSGARFFHPRRVDQLVEAMAVLGADPAERERLAAAGRANLARFSWEEAGHQTAAVLRSAASAAGRSR